MGMPMCPGHPGRVGNLKLLIRGVVTWVCQTCYFEVKGEEEEEDD